jgi:hypothetical protein
MAHGTTHEHAPGQTHEPVVHDPEHDIDAKSATIWVVGWHESCCSCPSG